MGIRPRRWIIGLLAVGLIIAAASLWQGRSTRTEPRQPSASRPDCLLRPQAMVVAPGVYVLGEMAPSVVYVIDTSDGLVLIDSGFEYEKLSRQMRELGLDARRIKAILLTHAHGDHSMGAMRLRSESGALIYAGQADAGVLRAGGPYEAIFSGFDMPPDVHPHSTEVDVELSGDEELKFGDASVRVVATPGHTPGSVCYLVQHGGLRLLFSGDTLMSLSDGLGTYAARLPPRYRGDAAAYLTSLRKLQALSPPDLLLPGHPGSDTTPQNPYIPVSRWRSLLGRGIRELETLQSRLAADGADFLDGQAKEILPGLHYLGDVGGSAEYCMVTPSELWLVDAAGGDELPNWLDARLHESGLDPRRLSVVLLTSAAPDAVAGLPALLRHAAPKVVCSEAARAVLERICPSGTELLSAKEFEASAPISASTIPLADVRPGALAYVVRWSGKTVLFSGRMPFQGDFADQKAWKQCLDDGRIDRVAYGECLNALLGVWPDVWLPAVRRHGRNANLYDEQWAEIVERQRKLLVEGPVLEAE